MLAEDAFVYLDQEFDVVLLGLLNGRLVNVQLSIAANDLEEEDRIFRVVENKLVERFGSPNHSQPDYLYWLFPSTTVSLTTSALEGKPEPEVQLVFFPADGGDANDQDGYH